MIKCSVRLLPPIVTALISVARSFVGACMWRVTADHVAGASKMMTPAREQCLSSNCHMSNVHLSFAMDEIPSLCIVCFPRGYLSESLPPGRKQDAGKQNPCHV
jgi:hypothetical protein